jgi:hypothetical protein
MTVLPDDHLTTAPIDRVARETFPGQAHFAGTGPSFTTCRECAFWDNRRDYHSKRGKNRGLIKPARCRKFRALTGTNGAKIPDDAPACRHFEQANPIPPRFVRTSK